MGDVLPKVWTGGAADSLEFMEEGFVEGGDTVDIAPRVELDSEVFLGNVVTSTTVHRSCDVVHSPQHPVVACPPFLSPLKALMPTRALRMDEKPNETSEPQSEFYFYDHGKAGISRPARRKLTGSQDLLAHFGLLPMYDRFVRPHPPPNRAAGLQPSYYEYISDLPGNVDPKPDNTLMNLIRNPDAPKSLIVPFDQEALREAFNLRPGPVPGFDYARLDTDGTNDGAARLNDTVNSRAHASTGVGSTFVPREPESRPDFRVQASAEGVESGTEKKHKKKDKDQHGEHEHGAHHRGTEEGENGDVVVD
ncbi:hypothetical protein BC937DRAFT_91670 [Endogone sp. FLAS-F59071]|nr:hypothetical protein BC937DRAFT_91670 [Endogone sp. FLAS-F59071]|eukprot:RUS16041.1 hypothetical protein BC937DRAFT_91670 [Endogone sp. FLAS-F59071]